jgi:succinate-acetate transporter protein
LIPQRTALNRLWGDHHKIVTRQWPNEAHFRTRFFPICHKTASVGATIQPAETRSYKGNAMNYANPAPIGLLGFAFTTWLLSLVNAGFYTGESVPMVLAMALAFGGTAQFIAGLLEYPRGNTFGFVAFCGYGAFWWSFALFVKFFSSGVPASFVGWYLALWGAFTVAMLMATCKSNLVAKLLFTALTITFAALSAGEFTGSASLHHAGGYLGLLTAFLAFYLAAAEVINEAAGKTVLPIGAP